MAPNDSKNNIPQEILVSLVPILAQLPKFVDFSTYVEFEDSEIPECEKCSLLCEFAYFKILQFNSDGMEICGSCLEKKYRTKPWMLHVRKGLIHYLNSLNAVMKRHSSTEPVLRLGNQNSNVVQARGASVLKPPSQTCCKSVTVETHSQSVAVSRPQSMETMSMSGQHIKLPTPCARDIQPDAQLGGIPPNVLE